MRFNKMDRIIRIILQIVLSNIATSVKASQCGTSEANITGGVYEPTVYSNSFIIREVQYVGPKGCIRECLYQMGCDAVNYKTTYKCELLSTSPGDNQWNRNYSLFTEITDWEMDQDQCWPNPCNTSEQCIVAKHGYHVCVPVENACESNPCLYGGSCRNTVDGTRCECATGYSGDICQITPCASSPCYYGTCSPKGPRYTCTCPTNYSGTRCEVTPCSNNPCQYQGTCSLNGSGYTCACQTNYSGTRCEVTPCSNNPCQYQGTCSLNGPGYTCGCQTNYRGTRCEVTPCSTHPCLNQGTCNLSGTWYTCTCAAGYSGTTCQVTPCSNNPCQNGGVCNTSGSGYTCSCQTGYAGINCENLTG